MELWGLRSVLIKASSHPRDCLDRYGLKMDAPEATFFSGGAGIAKWCSNGIIALFSTIMPAAVTLVLCEALSRFAFFIAVVLIVCKRYTSLPSQFDFKAVKTSLTLVLSIMLRGGMRQLVDCCRPSTVPLLGAEL